MWWIRADTYICKFYFNFFIVFISFFKTCGTIFNKFDIYLIKLLENTHIWFQFVATTALVLRLFILFWIKGLKVFVNVSSLINELLGFPRPGPCFKKIWLEIVTKTE